MLHVLLDAPLGFETLISEGRRQKPHLLPKANQLGPSGSELAPRYSCKLKAASALDHPEWDAGTSGWAVMVGLRRVGNHEG